MFQDFVVAFVLSNILIITEIAMMMIHFGGLHNQKKYDLDELT